jgi:hypothetical protein
MLHFGQTLETTTSAQAAIRAALLSFPITFIRADITREACFFIVHFPLSLVGFFDF